MGELKEKEKTEEIQGNDKRYRKKEKEMAESITRFKFEVEERTERKIAEMEKESYQAEAKFSEMKGRLARLNLERRQGKTKDR